MIEASHLAPLQDTRTLYHTCNQLKRIPSKICACGQVLGSPLTGIWDLSVPVSDNPRTRAPFHLRRNLNKIVVAHGLPSGHSA